MIVKWVTKNLRGVRAEAPPALDHWPPSSGEASGSSARASACAIEPPTVPRLRVASVPDEGHASRASGTRSRIAWRRAPPGARARRRRTPSSASPIASSPATRLMSTRRPAGEPHVQERHEALAAGEDLGVVAVLGQRRRPPRRPLGRAERQRRRGLHGPAHGSSVPDPRRRERQLDVVAAERVGDRVRDRGGRAHRAALAETLGAERREREAFPVRRSDGGSSGAVGQR